MSKKSNMRLKFPQIMCFRDWLELYELPDTDFYLKRRNLVEGQTDGIVNESSEMKQVRKQILSSLAKNQEVIEGIEAEMVKYMQLYVMENPPVYLAMLKDSRPNAEGSYLTAKTFWPLLGGNRKEIRIYIGTKEEFPEFKSQRVKSIAEQKMKEALRKRYENGEI